MDVRTRALASILPGVDISIRNGNMSRDMGLSIIKQACNRHYPEAIHAFACGSFLSGYSRPYSDLDVIITCRSKFNYQRKCVVFDGYPIDFQTLNIDTLKGNISRAKRGGVAFTAHALLSAEIVCDSDGHAAALLSWVNREWQKQEVTPHTPTIEMLKMSLGDLLLAVFRLDVGANRTPLR